MDIGDDNETLARWYSLLTANAIIGDACSGNDDCVSNHSNAIWTYMKDVSGDILFYIEKLGKGEEIPDECQDATYDYFVRVAGL